MLGVLPSRVGIILFNCFLVMVGYMPECSSAVYSSSSGIIYLSSLSLLSIYIVVGSCVSSSGSYT